MASFDGRDPQESPPIDPTNSEPPLPPDTEEHVEQQTEEIVRVFIHECHELDLQNQGMMDYDQTPSIPECPRLDPLSPASRVGRQLAMIGDDINDRYSEQFRDMMKILKLTPDTAYESFAGVARRLFSDGYINWGRIVTLLSFGYRIATDVLMRGMHSFFRKVVQFVVEFIIKEKIAKWIAEQGGWLAALRYVPDTVGWPTIGMIGAFAITSIVLAYWLSKR